MYKSLFNKNRSEVSVRESKIGLTKEQPVLMNSISSSYSYLNSLCSIAEGLSYERIGSIENQRYPNPIDKYIFTLDDSNFCEIFIYPYHQDNVNAIPTPFIELYPNVTEDIFITQDQGTNKTEEPQKISTLQHFTIIVNLIILKIEVFPDSDVQWSPEKQIALKDLMSELGYEDELEKLILDELKKTRADNQTITKNNFIDYFISQFHNKKITKYTPDFIQSRNKKIVTAYGFIIETINRIQACIDNELVRKRIEINTLNNSSDNSLGMSIINKCITPFCFVNLECDVFGRYNLSFGIDSRILNMVPDNMASTLLRRIYEFTPGELELFVSFESLSMDCISYFENSLQEDKNQNYQLIDVQRNEEQPISEMFDQLEIRDDVDEETKKWFKR
jgi:hypothetical protein